MSVPPLQELLLQPDQAGAFYLTASDLPPLQDAARELGFHCVAIDLAGCGSKPELMRRFAVALEFPPHTGTNWDALADSLRDLQWLPADGYVLGLENAQSLRDADPTGYDMLVSVLEESSLQWRDLGLPFWAFIALPDDEFDALQV